MYVDSNGQAQWEKKRLSHPDNRFSPKYSVNGRLVYSKHTYFMALKVIVYCRIHQIYAYQVKSSLDFSVLIYQSISGTNTLLGTTIQLKTKCPLLFYLSVSLYVCVSAVQASRIEPETNIISRFETSFLQSVPLTVSSFVCCGCQPFIFAQNRLHSAREIIKKKKSTFYLHTNLGTHTK